MAYVCIVCHTQRPQRFDECPKCEGIDTCTRIKETKKDRILRLSDIEPADDERSTTGRPDWDAVLGGGGTVKNMVVLVPGKPGFGKTSELLRIAHHLGTPSKPIAFGSSERPVASIALRAQQLDVDRARITPQRVYDSEEFLDHVEATGARHAMLDSWGGLGRHRHVDHIKALRGLIGDGTLWIVCHVTKSGELAGEHELEHEVDAVVWVRRTNLRASKNWHGPAPLSIRRQLPPKEIRPGAQATEPRPSKKVAGASHLRALR